jgi:hypothetical protein
MDHTFERDYCNPIIGIGTQDKLTHDDKNAINFNYLFLMDIDLVWILLPCMPRLYVKEFTAVSRALGPFNLTLIFFLLSN